MDGSMRQAAEQAAEQVAEQAAFQPLVEDKKNVPQAKEIPDLDLILDIPVEVSVSIGRTTLSIRQLLQLNQGAVVELEQLVGTPLDVLVNGVLLAHGEVVVIHDKFGVRLTDVISQSERIKRLKS